MGRAERRRMERRNRIEERKGKMLMSRSEISEMKRNVSHETSQNNVEHLMTLFALSLYENYGFDVDKIQPCLETIDKYCGMINNDEITMDEIIAKVEDEAGIIIRCED